MLQYTVSECVIKLPLPLDYGTGDIFALCLMLFIQKIYYQRTFSFSLSIECVAGGDLNVNTVTCGKKRGSMKSHKLGKLDGEETSRDPPLGPLK